MYQFSVKVGFLIFEVKELSIVSFTQEIPTSFYHLKIYLQLRKRERKKEREREREKERGILS